MRTAVREGTLLIVKLIELFIKEGDLDEDAYRW